MINVKSLVKRVLATLFIFLFSYNVCEASFIIHNEGILTDKTSEKLETIANELKAKTGISAYISVRTNIGGNNIVDYSKNLASNINGSYVILIFTQLEHKVDIISSKDVETLFNKDKVLNDYTIPLLASIDKNSENARYNAGILNGFSELAEEIAKNKNITLENTIGSESSDIVQFLRVIFYMSLLGFAVYYFYNSFFRRKK